MTRPFAAIVIGAGSGGLTVAVGLTGFGKRVALIERGRIGGDCTNVGCIPSKTLIHEAQASPGAPPAEVLARVRTRRDELQDEEAAWVEGMPGLTLLRGTARFEGRRELEVALTDGGVRRVRGGTIVIATGSRPKTVEIPGLPSERTLTNESLFELEDAPEHLAIVGAGAIGCEMAFAFRSLGSRVTVLQRSERVLSALEPEAGNLIQERMRRAGIQVLLGVRAERYDEPSRTLLTSRSGETLPVDGVDRVLLALGRRPNLDLNPAAAGVEAGPGGIDADAWGRTDVGHIFAVGDVTTRAGTTHAANAQGRRAVRKIALPWLPGGAAPALPAAVFTDPEVAHVGPPLVQLRKRYPANLIRSLRVDLADTDRGYTMGIRDGFVLVHALRLSGRVLGATIVAPAAGEMIPLLTLAMQRRVRLWALSELVVPYPVLSEAIKKVADAFVFESLPKLPRELSAYLRLRWRRPRA